MQETITRTETAPGKYRYESSERGVLYEASKVFFTHVAHYTVNDGEPLGPLTLHKTAAAAMKASCKYWIKTGTAEIVEAAA